MVQRGISMYCYHTGAVHSIWIGLHIFKELLHGLVCGQFHVVLGIYDYLRHMACVGITESVVHDHERRSRGHDWKGSRYLRSGWCVNTVLAVSVGVIEVN